MLDQILRSSGSDRDSSVSQSHSVITLKNKDLSHLRDSGDSLNTLYAREVKSNKGARRITRVTESLVTKPPRSCAAHHAQTHAPPVGCRTSLARVDAAPSVRPTLARYPATQPWPTWANGWPLSRGCQSGRFFEGIRYLAGQEKTLISRGTDAVNQFVGCR